MICWYQINPADDAPSFGGKNDNNKIEGATSTAATSISVAGSDGLHLYLPKKKVGVCPIDGKKLAMCSLPVVYLRRPFRRSAFQAWMVGLLQNNEAITMEISGAGASYALVATTDVKSPRDAIDIYDTSNKLVGFHVVRWAIKRRGTEKATSDKIELSSLAFSDPQFYCPEDIVGLYRRYAEHLYRKGVS